jgi:hypothetical protein
MQEPISPAASKSIGAVSKKVGVEVVVSLIAVECGETRQTRKGLKRERKARNTTS